MTNTVGHSGGSDRSGGRQRMLQVERQAGVTVLRLDHGKVNALDLELLTLLAETMEGLTDAVVLTGAGSSFCAGVDLRRIVSEDPEQTDDFLAALSQALLAVFRHPHPVVAAVNGHAIAGGCVLAAAADLRLMSGGSIGLTELRVGVPFPTAALEIVRYAVGSTTHPLTLFAELYDPQRAHALGLLHGVSDPERLLDDALDWANRLAAIGPAAFALTKRQLHAPTEERIAARSELDDDAVRRVWRSPEGRAAIGSFLDGLGRASRALAEPRRQGENDPAEALKMSPPPRATAADVINEPVRVQFEVFLDEHRAALQGCLDGLTEEQARRSLVSSRTTLLGLVKHATFVEKVWFDEAVTRRPRAEIGIPATPDESFILDAEDTIASVQHAHREACESARLATSALGLDDVIHGNRRGALPLRWVYLHVLRELAQHCGHADILREQLLTP